MNTQNLLDLVGIGIGPFNLSVAALMKNQNHYSSRFFDARDTFSWHPGLLLPDTHMQTSFLKDLVTAVAPTSCYSFLSYLVDKKKFYRFISAEQFNVTRHEFSDYLYWVSNQLDNVQFATKVEYISFTDDKFQVETNKGKYYAQHLCLGTGRKPFIPQCAKAHLGSSVFHASEIKFKEINLTDQNVVIIGGGQSGADVFINVMREHWGKPRDLKWLSRRSNFEALDEAAFTNEYYSPEYVENFIKLHDDIKKREIHAQKLTSDGITQGALLSIYRELYHRFDVMGEPRWINLYPHREVKQLHKKGSSFQLIATNGLQQSTELYEADMVILATGFEGQLAPCLSGLKERLTLSKTGQLQLNKQFDVQWDGPDTNRIYAVNAGLHSHGIAELQLSLMAWRSANIINHLCGEKIFDIEPSRGYIEWETITPLKEKAA